MPRRRDKGEERGMALRRIAVLLERARLEALGGRMDLADRYAHLSRELAQKHQTGFGPAKGRVCRSCGAFLVPGRTSRVRLTGGRVSATCLRCGRVARRPLR